MASNNVKKVPMYIRNVSKSIMYSGQTFLKATMPNAADFTESNAELVKSIATDLRSYKTIYKQAKTWWDSSSYMGDLKDLKKNAIEDLKTGNFYNRDRAGQEAFKSMGWEDVFAGFDDLNSDVDFESSGDSVTSNAINTNTEATVGVMSAVGTTIAHSVTGSAEYLAANQNNIASKTMVNNMKIFNEVNNALVDISTTLHGIFDYTKETSKFYDANMKMQEDIKNLNAEMSALLKESTEMKRNQYKAYNKSLEANYRTNDMDDFMSGDTLNIAEYAKTIVKRAKKELENSEIGTMMSMSGSQGVDPLKMLASNPLSFISNAAFNKMVSKELRKSMSEMDETLGSFFKSSLLKMGTQLRMKGEDTGNGMFDTLYRILGVNTKVPTKMRTDLYVKEAIPFNGMTNRAIVEVIPTYLRKMLATMTNQEEMIYDYNAGKFNRISEVNKNYNNEVDNSYSGVLGMENDIKNMTKALGLNNDEQMKLDKDIKQFFKFAVDNSWFINPNKDKFDTYRSMGLELEGREDSFNVIKNALAAKGRKELNKFNNDIINTNQQRLNAIDNMTKTGQERGITGVNNGFKNNINGTDNVKLKTGIFITDKYDNSIFDYLKTIRDTLLEGVRVYTTGLMTEEDNSRLNERFTRVTSKDNSNNRRMEIPVVVASTYTRTPEQIATEAKKLGSKAFNRMSNITLSDEGQQNVFREAERIQNNKPTNQDNQNSIVNKINNSKVVGGIRGIFDAGKELASVPGRLIKDTLDTLNDNMLTFLYGKDGDSDKVSLFDGFIERINAFGDRISKTINDHVITPLNKLLFDEEKGLMVKFRNWITPIADKLKDSLFNQNTGIIPKIKNSVSSFLYGDEKHKGALDVTKNSFLDIKDEFINIISGKGYTSRTTGKVHPDRQENIVSIFKNTFNTVKQGFKDIFKGAGKTNFVSGLKDNVFNRMNIMSSSVGKTLFGDTNITSARDLYDKHFSHRLPRTLLGGTLGLGLSLFTPLGLVGGLMAGSSLGMLSTSSRFTTAIFGELGSDKRMKYENFVSSLKQAAPKMGVGAILGGLSSLVTPFGFIGSTVIGSTLGYLSSSDKFKTWLFGDETRDGKISKEWQSKFKDAYPRALIGSGLGLLGSFFTPLGPIGGAVTGLAIGIASMSDKVKTWMFGDENPETGKRQGGIFGKFKLWFKAEIANPFLTFTKSILNEGLYFFRKSMLNPILDALSPIKKEMSLIKDAIFNKIGEIKDSIVDKFNNRVIRPFGETMDKYVLDPMKKTFKSLFSNIWKAMKGIITMPSNLINGLGNSLYAKHKRNGVADYEDDWIKSKNKRNAKTEKDYRERKTRLKAEKDKNKLATNLMRKGKFDINDPATQRGMAWLNMENNKSVSRLADNSDKTNSILDNIKNLFDDFKTKWDSDKENRKRMLDRLNDLLPDKNNKGNYNNDNNSNQPKVLDAEFTRDEPDKPDSKVIQFPNNNNNNKDINSNQPKVLDAEFTRDEPSKTNKPDSKVIQFPNNNKDINSNQPKVLDAEFTRDEPDKTNKPDLSTDESEKPKSTLFNNSLNMNTAVNIATIANSVDQYNGVGYNTEMIANILIDQFGRPSIMPGGPKGIVSKAKGLLSSVLGGLGSIIKAPFKILGSLKNVIMSPIKAIVKGTFDALSAIPKAIVNVGSEVLKTTISMIGGVGKVAASVVTSIFQSLPAVINTLGNVISSTTKVIGAVSVELVKGVGTMANTMIKVSGELVTGLTKLAAETIPFVAKTLVGTVSFIGSAIGKVVGGSFSLAKGLIFGKSKKSTEKTIKRIDTLTTVETVNKVISLESINDKRIYESLGNIVTAIHQLRTGTDDISIHDSATREEAGKNVTDKGAQGVKNVVVNIKDAANKIENKKKAKERNKPSALNQSTQETNNVINFPTTGNGQVDKFKNKERNELLTKKATTKAKLENKSMIANIGSNKILDNAFGKKSLFMTLGNLLLTGLPILFTWVKNFKNNAFSLGKKLVTNIVDDLLRKFGIGGGKGFVEKAGKEVIEEGAEAVVKSTITKGATEGVENAVEKKVGKSIFSKAGKKFTESALVTGTKKIGVDIIQKVMSCSAIKKLAGSKIASVLGKVSTFLISRMKNAGSKIFAKISAKWAAMIGAGSISGGLIPAIWYGGEIMNGVSKTNQIFGMSPSYKPSLLMRTIAGFSEFVSMNVTWGIVPASLIANFIGGFLLTDKDKSIISDGKVQLDKEYEEYIAKTGDEISKDDYNEKIANRSLVGKLWDGTKSTVKGIGKYVTEKTPFAAFNNDKIRQTFNLEESDDIKFSQRVSQGIAGSVSALTGGFIDTTPIAKTTQKVFDLAGKVWNNVWEGLQEHSILSAFDTSRVKETFGLDENVAPTLTQRVSQGIGGALSGMTFGLVKPDSIARTIDGATVAISELWGKVWDGVQEHSVLAFFDDSKIRETYELGEGDNISLTHRISSSFGGMISGMTFGIVDQGPISKTINNTFEYIGGLWQPISDFFKGWKSKIDEKLSSFDKWLNKILGNDDNANNDIPTSEVTDATKKEGWWSKSKNYITEKYDQATKWFQDKSKSKSQAMNAGGAGDENSTIKYNYKKPKYHEFGMSQTMTNGGMGDLEMQNGAVYYSQNAEPWASVDYGGGKNISQAGCGPTSAAMLLSSVTGQEITPTQAAEYSMRTGHRIIGNGTDWSFFNDIGSQYGVQFTQTADYTQLQTALSNGMPAILSGKGAAPFTKGGHFVMAVGMDSSGNVIINDPVSKERSKSYPFSQIASSAAQAWISNKALTGGSVSSNSVADTSGTNSTNNNENPFTKAFADLASITSGFITDGITGTEFSADKWLESNVASTSESVSASGGSMGGTYGSLVIPNDVAVGTSPLSEDVMKYANAFDEAGNKYGVDGNVLKAISMQESGGRVNASNGYALGLMQIENTLGEEFSNFGKSYDGNAWSLADRADPNKAIPFAANRLSSDLNHYTGDYLKTIQAYNFSKYSLDKLIAKYGDDWRSHTGEMGELNGQGSPYGDKEYIPHVLRYYHNGGAGDESSSNILEFKNTKTTMFGNHYNMGLGAAGDETPVKVNEPSVDISSFTSNSDYKMSETINDFLTAKELAETNNIAETTAFNKLLQLVEQIVVNTSNIANDTSIIKDNTENISKKDNVNINNNNTLNNTSNNVSTSSKDPFANFASSNSSTKVNNAYQNAMQIARGVKQ